jgi:hypothetical protein
MVLYFIFQTTRKQKQIFFKMAAKWKISSLFQLALMSSVLAKIDYNEDCEKVLRYADIFSHLSICTIVF